MTKSKTPLRVEILRDWYFIDSVLLNDHAKHAITEDKDYQEYISLKAALLSDLHEFYTHIEYTPLTESVPENHRALQEMAVNTAKKTKVVSASMIERKDFMTAIKKRILSEIKRKGGESDPTTISDNIINERFLKICLDNVLVGGPIIECGNKSRIDDFKGDILEQAYLTVRSEMIKIAKKYNPTFKKNVNEATSAAALGFTAIAGFLLAGPIARSVESFGNRCQARCGSLLIHTRGKQACVLKCKIQMQQKIITGLRQMAAQTNNARSRNKFARDVKRAQMRMTQYQRKLAEIQAKAPAAGDLDPSERGRLV